MADALGTKTVQERQRVYFIAMPRSGGAAINGTAASISTAMPARDQPRLPASARRALDQGTLHSRSNRRLYQPRVSERAGGARSRSSRTFSRERSGEALNIIANSPAAIVMFVEGIGDPDYWASGPPVPRAPGRNRLSISRNKSADRNGFASTLSAPSPFAKPR